MATRLRQLEVDDIENSSGSAPKSITIVLTRENQEWTHRRYLCWF